MEILSDFGPWVVVVVAVIFTWVMNALGSGGVFVFRSVDRRALDLMLGFSAGVMLAASIWSLLVPAMDISDFLGLPGWLVVGASFVLGSGFAKLLDSAVPHLHMGAETSEGMPSSLKKPVLLFLAMTLHHLPEGFAIGVAVGAAELLPNYNGLSVIIGIGVQNVPEGLAIACAMLAYGATKLKSFFLGTLSGLAEVVGGIIGFLVISSLPQVLPVSLAFAAGTMFFVIVEELIPEAQLSGNTDVSTIGTILGFVIMMSLDSMIL